MLRRILALIVTLTLAVSIGMVAACGGKKDEAAPALTSAQRDSVLGGSQLPGASAVRGALDVADSASARAGRADDLSNR